MVIQDSGVKPVGLPAKHPLVRFAKKPDDLERILALDDTVFLGSLSTLCESRDTLISNFAMRLLYRNLLKCVDIRSQVTHILDPKNEQRPELIKTIDVCCDRVLVKLKVLNDKRKKNGIPAILTDKVQRSAYKTAKDSKGPTERINVKTEGGELLDLGKRSKIVANIDEYKICRAYFDRDNHEIERNINEVIKEESTKCEKREPS